MDVEHYLKTYLLILLPLILVSCATKITFETEPTATEVSASTNGEIFEKLGTTPLTISDTELSAKLKLDPARSDLVLFRLNKKDFKTNLFYLSANRWGETEKVLKIKMIPGKDDHTLAKEIVQHFVNAQRFSDIRQFEQAHFQLDKVLEIMPDSSQAMIMKGALYFLQNQNEESLKWYEKAISIDPGLTEAIKMVEKLKAKRSSGL